MDEPAPVRADGAVACPCGGDMWYLAFGYDAWVCRQNTRHWYRPRTGGWSRDASSGRP
ncbi:MAG TPA: hypothetical protein VGB19_06045 [Actinomycetota bacterium]